MEKGVELASEARCSKSPALDIARKLAEKNLFFLLTTFRAQVAPGRGCS